MIEDALKHLFAKKAETDGQYAIAFALLELSSRQRETAAALQALGNGNAASSFGAVENLAMKVDAVATAISYVGTDVAGAIGRLADTE